MVHEAQPQLIKVSGIVRERLIELDRRGNQTAAQEP
jgi:hypothetical protein